MVRGYQIIMLVVLCMWCLFQRPVKAMRYSPIIGDASKEISGGHQDKTKPQQQHSNPSSTGNKPDTAPKPADQKSEGNKKTEVRITDIPSIALVRDNIALTISIVLGVVGVIGIIVATSTLNTIKEQTTAIKEATDATKINTQIMVNSERAWVVVSLTGVPEPTADTLAVNVLPFVRNFGRTTTQIIEFSIRWEAVQSPVGLAPEPNYTSSHPTSIILPPDTPLQPMIVGVPEAIYRNAMENRGFLCTYGYVDYIILEKERKRTRFCYMYYSRFTSMGLPQPGFYVGIQALETYKKCT